MYADRVLLGGSVITIDWKKPRAEAIAIKDGKFLLVGSNEEVREMVGKGTEVRDLGGMTVVPGFNDAHNHPLQFAIAVEDIDLGQPSVRSIRDILNLVAEQAKQQAKGTWINCRGYDHNQLAERRHITRWELDEVAPDHFVRLKHFGLHSNVVNSKVLALAGITKDTTDPEGGKIERAPRSGEPTGVILEMPAIALIDKIMPKTSYEDIIEYLRIVNQRYLAEGVTSSSDAGVGLQSSDWPRIIGAYQEAVETGVLNIRCNLQVWHEIFLDYSHIDEELQEIDNRLFKLGIRSGLGDEKLRIGPIKIIMDGGVSLGTAATYEPYGAQPENQGTGILTMEPELLTRIVSALHYRGWQMSIHAIGDRAVDVVLNAYEAALREQLRANHRHHIEHCIIMNVGQMTQMKKLGVLCVTQPHFIWDAGDSFAYQLGKQRTEETLRFRTMLDNSLFTVFSSDRPCTSGAPLLGIHAAVNRKTKSGENYGLGEAISAEEALRLYTINGAYTTFEEGIKGSIEAGKLADLVVLAEDPTKGDPERIKDIPVVATMVGGEVVYEK